MLYVPFKRLRLTVTRMQIQYMVAVPLIFGRLTTEDYSDAVAADPRIDALREKVSKSPYNTFRIRTDNSICALDGVR